MQKQPGTHPTAFRERWWQQKYTVLMPVKINKCSADSEKAAAEDQLWQAPFQSNNHQDINDGKKPVIVIYIDG